MPGPIDATLKQLTELSPQDWVVRGGWPAAPAALIDADIATISGAADKAIRVTGTPDWLLPVDFQAGRGKGGRGKGARPSHAFSPFRSPRPSYSGILGPQ
jgi:hypothetical protein